MSINKKALVLFSGGQDSTITLVWALQNFQRVETIGFDYTQRHHIELQCRQEILSTLRQYDGWSTQRLGEDHIVDLSGMKEIWNNAMTRSIMIEKGADGVPNTFVPGRNLLFLQIAASLAYGQGVRHLVVGMSEAESSGYPDCRQVALSATIAAINTGMDANFELHTPLMDLHKSEVWGLASDLGGAALLELIIEKTHTCYLGERKERHPWGYGCGNCPACLLRASGYQRFANTSSISYIS